MDLSVRVCSQPGGSSVNEVVLSRVSVGVQEPLALALLQEEASSPVVESMTRALLASRRGM